MKDKSFLILKDNRIIRSILLLSLPIMISNILKSLHDIVDMYFISNINDKVEIVEAQVSAITVTGPHYANMSSLCVRTYDCRDSYHESIPWCKSDRKSKKVSGQLLILSVLIGIIFNLLLFLMAPLILQWMGADTSSNLYKYSVYYVQYRSFEQVGLFVIYAFQMLVVSQLAIQSHQLF